MTDEDKIYQPLGGRARSLFSVAVSTSERLYLGPDHLLYLRNEQFSESYKRFYFRDIQALVMTVTTGRRTMNLAIFVTALVCSAVAWMIGAATDAAVGAYLQVFFVGLFGILFAVNSAAGPTCKCQVKTAVHTHPLASLKRVRAARRVFERVSPLIAAAQGELSPDQVSWEPAAAAAMTAAATAAAPGRLVSRPPEPVRHEAGGFHQLLFAMLLLDVVITAVDFLVNNLGLTLASTLLTFAILGILITALVRQQQSDIPTKLRRLTWVTLGYLILLMALGYVHLMVMSVQNPRIQGDQWEWLKLVSQQSPDESVLLLVMYLLSIFGSLALGLLGMLALREHHRNHPAEEEVPSA